MKNRTKSIILLSGGLDSLVALGAFKDEYNIELALTFDYGQKSNDYELDSAKKIAKHYGIEYQIIKLDWLKKITKTALVSENEIPTSELGSLKSAKQVWVPNRNGLFLNIAAAYSDAYGYNNIIFGANKDEGMTFSDNTEEFRQKATDMFQSSTLVHPQVIAPLINYSKDDIVKIALGNDVPLELVRSCYADSIKHCGVCESCTHLKNALLNNQAYNYVNILFGE